MTRRMWLACLAATALAATANTATAGLLPVSVTVDPQGGGFRWTYTVVLPTNLRLQSGSYFTIYDFAGYQPGSAAVTAAAGSAGYWTAESDPLGRTPGRLLPDDDPAVPNLTFVYHGPTTAPGRRVLGTFAATSAYGTAADGFFTATNPRASDGRADSNITTALVPVAPPPVAATPEPATWVLTGLGLPLLGLWRAGRRAVAA